MLTDLRLIYWDACCPLAYINGEQARLPHLEGLMQRSGKDHQLITSVYSKTEVAFGKLEQDKKELDKETEDKILKLWLLGSPIQLVELYEIMAEKAAQLIRKALLKGWHLKPGDAIHLATADHLKVSEFQTYDESLDKFREITDTHFPICRPIAGQPVMVIPPSQKEETPSETPRKPEAPTATPAQGIRSGPTEGQD